MKQDRESDVAGELSDRNLLEAIRRHLDLRALREEFPQLNDAQVERFFGRMKDALPDGRTRNSMASGDHRSMGGKSEVAILYSDGGSRGNPGPAGCGAVLTDPTGRTLAEISEPIGRATNNVAEYQALILGLEAAAERGVQELTVRCDSELIVHQLNGIYKVRNAGLKPLHERARKLLAGFRSVRIEHVRREMNRKADALANAAMDRARG